MNAYNNQKDLIYQKSSFLFFQNPNYQPDYYKNYDYNSLKDKNLS